MENCLPNVWCGEEVPFEMRRERYKRIKFLTGDRSSPAQEDSPAVNALRDFLDVVHRRGRDAYRQPLYEEWARLAAGNGILEMRRNNRWLFLFLSWKG